jgi:CheY-like chemotaxis protein
VEALVTQHEQDWRRLAEQVSKETDPNKMMGFLEELNRVLDEGKKPKLVLRWSGDTSENAPVVEQKANAIRILVAEDNVSVRRKLCDILRTAPDFEIVYESADANGAIGKTVALQPTVVVVDISLPDMSGIEVVRQLRKVAPSAEIIMCSNYDEPHIVKGALEAGARGYVIKSDAANELVAAVRAVCKRERYVSPTLSRNF